MLNADFCKKQNLLVYEVPNFYDHKALDEMQLRFKIFAAYIVTYEMDSN